jgi:hypothetical protein
MDPHGLTAHGEYLLRDMKAAAEANPPRFDVHPDGTIIPGGCDCRLKEWELRRGKLVCLTCGCVLATGVTLRKNVLTWLKNLVDGPTRAKGRAY